MGRYRALITRLAGVTLVGVLSLSAGPAGARQGNLGGASPGRGYPVWVYFSRHPISDDRFGAVHAMRRVSPTLGVATFALQQLLVGPTRAEAAAGYYTEWPQAAYGPSSCGPRGFTLRLNWRGSMPAAGTATVQLCRRLHVPGVGASARMTAELQATLRQFAAIRSVVILTTAGTCFGDLSGLNRCLRVTT